MATTMHRSRSFTLSPKKQNGFIVPTAHQFVTPSSRRQSFNTPPHSLVLLDGSENNDEAEKRERHLNRLHQLQARGISSPTGTPVDRRKSISSFAGLTNQQITDHYSKCIQLSAENKINIKNAFNLQLIDYMTELLKRKDSDMNNFQVASCTLDASTKIYGYRVDSVHTDTLKMAGGLGRTKEKLHPSLEEPEDEEDIRKGKRKLKTKKCVTIEKNLKNLDVPHFDLEFDVDPLFKKTASQFDDGNAGGSQFLNSLQMLDDTCQLLLDSETVLDSGGEQTLFNTETVAIPPILDAGKIISPTSSSFEFTSWRLGDNNDTPFGELSRSRRHSTSAEDDKHVFDMNATPEPLEVDSMEFSNEGGFIEDDAGELQETVITVGGGACMQVSRALPPQLEIVHLKDHLTNTPLEYSYFDTRVMSAWAGPGHWKLTALSRGSLSSQKANNIKAKEKQKKNVVLEYNKDMDVEKHFSVLRRATKLSQLTVKKWSVHNNSLPADQHYDPAKLSELYLRSGIMIRRQPPETPPTVVDDDIKDYNYDNPNDNDNYCPDVGEEGDQSNPGYDDTELFSQSIFPSQRTQDPDEARIRDFLGNNLVEAPNKVSLINIGYARTAKKIDMKKLKSSIWSLLSHSNVNKEDGAESTVMGKNSQKNFSKLYSDLYPRLSPKMAENLSVPLAFIALLHLANENCLSLASLEELGDFVISQG